MISDSEKQEIINAAVEQTLLRLPEVVGNLITNHISLLKMNREFYDKYPEFKDKKDIVTSVVEMVEGENPTLDYKDILSKAVPRIKERMNKVKGLDFEVRSRPNRDLSEYGIETDHGDL